MRSVSTYLHMSGDTPLPLYAPVHFLNEPPPFTQLRTYLMDVLFLNQKTNKNIRISYIQKYKHSIEQKYKHFYKKINVSVG